MLKSSAAAVVAALIAIVTAIPATAQQSCDAWQMARVQREEGRAWTASVCAPRKDRDAHLEIVCFGEKINIRYMPVLPDGADPLDTRWTFTLATSTGSHSLPMTFEAMDGAFTAYLDTAHPVFETIMSGAELTLREARGRVPETIYTLRGSRAAVSRLIGQCNQ